MDRMHRVRYRSNTEADSFACPAAQDVTKYQAHESKTGREEKTAEGTGEVGERNHLRAFFV
jgi:hypothetical protein